LPPNHFRIMQIKQQTVRETIAFEGKGLHTGKVARMTINPAPVGYGIKFRRTDLGVDALVEALAENVSNTARSTTLSNGAVSVVTVEHLLSALTGMGIDNALIEIDNIEVPILDGSAKPYVKAIKSAGIVEQDADRVFVEIDHEIEYRDDEKGIVINIVPAEVPSYDIKIDFNSKVVGVQTAHWDPTVDYYREVARCRTFCFFHELEFLFQNNLVKGGDVDNAIVIVEHPVTKEQLDHMCNLFGLPALDVDEDGYLTNAHLHYSNECARHKLLDLIGDMRLAGGFLKAKVTAVKSGHRTNTEAAKLIRQQLAK